MGFGDLTVLTRLILILLLFVAIILFLRNYSSIRNACSKIPSWVKASMKGALFAVVALFVIMMFVSIFALFKSDFSCSTCLFFGLCSGGSSFGGCFAWPMIMFVFGAAPAAIVGAIVGMIIGLIIKYKNKT